MDERRAVGRIEDVDVAGPVVGDAAGSALGDPPLPVDLHKPELAQTHVDTDLMIAGQETVVGDHEHRSVPLEGPRGERGQDAIYAMVHVLESPVSLRGPGTVQMLEAVSAE